MTDPDPTTALLFKTRADWRAWLHHNHHTKTEVWLIHYKKPYHDHSISHLEAVEDAICYGWIDSKLKRLDDHRFILRYTPRKPTSVWSQINKDTAERMIAQRKMTDAGLTTIENAKKHRTWNKSYTNIKKERLPTDLKTALQTDPTAWTNFQTYANTYRNMYIGWINNAKTPATRHKRIMDVVKRSHHNKKPGIN